MADFRRRRVILFLMMRLDEEERKTINRTQWQRKWLQRREVMGAYHSIFMELALEDTTKLFEFIRMSYPKFLELLNLIGPSITRENTHLRSTIPILFVVFIPQKWVFTVKLDKDSGHGNAPSCFDRFTLTFRFFFPPF